VLDTSYKFVETTTVKNITVYDNYIYLIWILNVNYGFKLWVESLLIIKALINKLKAQNQKKPKKPKIRKAQKSPCRPWRDILVI
jgi:hypothetical protein